MGYLLSGQMLSCEVKASASSSSKGGVALVFNGGKWAQWVWGFKVLKFIDPKPHSSAPSKSGP